MKIDTSTGGEWAGLNIRARIGKLVYRGFRAGQMPSRFRVSPECWDDLFLLLTYNHHDPTFLLVQDDISINFIIGGYRIKVQSDMALSEWEIETLD